MWCNIGVFTTCEPRETSFQIIYSNYMYTDFWLYLVSKLLGNSLFELCPHLLLHVGHAANTCTIAHRGGHGDLRYCSIGLFFMRYFGNFNFAVSSSSAVCGFSSFWLMVFGEIRLFAVLQYRYRLFALSFRYNTQNKTQ